MGLDVMLLTPRGVERVTADCPGWVTQRVWDLRGWFTPAEAAAVVRGAVDIGPTGRLLELGTWRGRSAAILADALGPGWEVHTVDSYPPSYVGADAEDVSPAEALLAASAELDARTNVGRWIAQSDLSSVGGWWGAGGRPLGGATNAAALHALGGQGGLASAKPCGLRDLAPFRVLLVDAEHTAAAVERDIRFWLPFMALPSLIYVHDTTDPKVGADVSAGLAAVGLETKGWELVPALSPDSLKAFKRIR